jgi:hypothetical protein
MTETPAIAGVSRSTPGGTRTPNLLIRSQTLYPIELRALETGRIPSLPDVCTGYHRLQSRISSWKGRSKLTSAVPVAPSGQDWFTVSDPEM